MKQIYTELLLEDFGQHYWPVSPTLVGGQLHLLLVLDCLLCHILVGPLVTGYWRGVWSYSQLYLDQGLCDGDLTLANTIAIVVGLVGTSLIHVFHHEVRAGAGEPGTVRHTLLARAFSVWWGFFFVYFWKGTWDGISVWFAGGSTSSRRWEVSVICLAVGVVGAALTGTSRSAFSSPVGMRLDVSPNQLTAVTLEG